MTTALKGQFLIAMPGMEDTRFHESVVYLVGYGEEGAMGLMINQTLPEMQFSDIIDEMNIFPEDGPIEDQIIIKDREVLCGGPVDTERGFVLHSSDYEGTGNTYSVTDEVSLTATVDVLKAISVEDAPQNALFALGYCGWNPGQLENELKSNGWLTAPHSNDLLFQIPTEDRYDAALGLIGVTRANLGTVAGSLARSAHVN